MADADEREADVEQLAMFMQARDAHEFGTADKDGVSHPLWSELDEDLGRADYRRDARIILDAVGLLGYMKPAAPVPELSDSERGN